MISEKELALKLNEFIIKESKNTLQTTEVHYEGGYYVMHVNIPLQGYPDCGMTIYIVDGQVSLLSFPIVENVGTDKHEYLDLCNIVNEARDHYTFIYSSLDDSIRIKSAHFFELNSDGYGNKIYANEDFLMLKIFETILSIGRIWCTFLNDLS